MDILGGANSSWNTLNNTWSKNWLSVNLHLIIRSTIINQNQVNGSQI